MQVPGELEALSRYNDKWRGWPVAPMNGQDPIRDADLELGVAAG